MPCPDNHCAHQCHCVTAPPHLTGACYSYNDDDLCVCESGVTECECLKRRGSYWTPFDPVCEGDIFDVSCCKFDKSDCYQLSGILGDCSRWEQSGCQEGYTPIDSCDDCTTPCPCPCPETLNWTVSKFANFEDCTFSASDSASDTVTGYDGGCNGIYTYTDNGSFDCGSAWTSSISCDSSKAADSLDRWSGSMSSCGVTFNGPDGADNPEEVGSCSEAPVWTFSHDESPSACDCCEPLESGACCVDESLGIGSCIDLTGATVAEITNACNDLGGTLHLDTKCSTDPCTTTTTTTTTVAPTTQGPTTTTTTTTEEPPSQFGACCDPQTGDCFTVFGSSLSALENSCAGTFYPSQDCNDVECTTTTTTESPCPCPETLNWTGRMDPIETSTDLFCEELEASFSDTISGYDGGNDGTYAYQDSQEFDCGDTLSSTLVCDSNKSFDDPNRWELYLNSCYGSVTGSAYSTGGGGCDGFRVTSLSGPNVFSFQVADNTIHVRMALGLDEMECSCCDPTTTSTTTTPAPTTAAPTTAAPTTTTSTTPAPTTSGPETTPPP